MEPAATVEHVVLFKIRDGTDPAKTDAFVSALRSLAGLPLLSHLTAGPILRLCSPLAFTHLLHARYPSKSSLAAYASHPNHVSVVENHGAPICEDAMAVDWLVDAHLLSLPSNSAFRLTLAKPRAGVCSADVAEAAAAAAEGMEGSSFGANFSPARAKGYEVGSLMVFGSLEELDASVGDVTFEKVRDLVVVEEAIVLDYVVSMTGSGSL